MKKNCHVCNYTMHDDEHCFLVVSWGSNTIYSIPKNPQSPVFNLPYECTLRFSDGVKMEEKVAGLVWRCPNCDSISPDTWEYEPTENPLYSPVSQKALEAFIRHVNEKNGTDYKLDGEKR